MSTDPNNLAGTEFEIETKSNRTLTLYEHTVSGNLKKGFLIMFLKIVRLFKSIL